MNTFIFDLDGTLLPMPDQNLFLNLYMKNLSKKMLSQGIEAEKTMNALLAGTQAMIENDGSMTNEERFWSVFTSILGEKARELEQFFDQYYRNEFIAAKNSTGTHPLAKECIQVLKDKGYAIVLATNPIFPRIATLTRIEWAGLNHDDFELITTYDNSSYCKPNLKYYENILTLLNKQPSECIMIGNDVRDDMCAAALGMETFLLKDCLICSAEEDITIYPQGDFEDLKRIIDNLPVI